MTRSTNATLDRRTAAVIALAATAVAAIVALGLGPGLHVGFLLGGAGKGGAAQLSPFVQRVKGMSGPVAVLGAAFAVLGGTTGGTLLALGHPQGARMLGRTAVGAFVIAIAGTIVN